MFEGGFEVIDDLLGDDVGVGEVVGSFEGFVFEPEDSRLALSRAVCCRGNVLMQDLTLCSFCAPLSWTFTLLLLTFSMWSSTLFSAGFGFTALIIAPFRSLSR